MRQFARILTIIFAFIILTPKAGAVCKKSDIDNLIKSSQLNSRAVVAVSIKKANGADVYEYNSQKLLHPASVLKLLVLPANLDAVGKDYTFKTNLYKDDEGGLYIQLGADPLLTAGQLTSAIESLKLGNIRNIYIDDKILDRYEWGIGWMWDDDINPGMPKISPYNIGRNLINITVKPTNKGENAIIEIDKASPATIINMVKTADQTDIRAYRQNYISPNILYLYGTAAKQTQIKVPESNPELRFKNALVQILKEENVITPVISQGRYPQGAAPTYTIENQLQTAVSEILKNSDNFYAESVFKLAGGKKYNSQGTFANSEKMFNEYYKKAGLDTSKIVIADGSGVSRNNLFSTDWITSALAAIRKDKNFDYIKNNMAQGGTGTLSNRLGDIGPNLFAKTGTLSNLSSIAGYVKSKRAQEYVFSIIISNYNVDDSCAKDLENNIIKMIYDLK